MRPLFNLIYFPQHLLLCERPLTHFHCLSVDLCVRTALQEKIGKEKSKERCLTIAPNYMCRQWTDCHKVERKKKTENNRKQFKASKRKNWYWRNQKKRDSKENRKDGENNFEWKEREWKIKDRWNLIFLESLPFFPPHPALAVFFRHVVVLWYVFVYLSANRPALSYWIRKIWMGS